LVGISHRLSAIESQLAHLRTIGTWLFAGLLAAYAAIIGTYAVMLTVVVRISH
jgi:hypothetical protein